MILNTSRLFYERFDTELIQFIKGLGVNIINMDINYILPKICDANGNLEARWYVEYKYRNPDTLKFVKFREWISSKILTRTARSVKALEIKQKITLQLKSGYSPFEIKERSLNIEASINEVLKIKYATCGTRAKSTYTSIANKFINWLKANNYTTLKPTELNKAICQKYLDYLLIKKHCSNRTYNNNLSSLRTIFECMLERDYVDFNVWKKIKKLPTKEADISSFSREEREFLTDYLKAVNPRLYCIALLIYYCYLRPAEIVRLKISDFDFAKGQILVKGSNSKNGKNQIVIMHQHLINELLSIGLDKYNSDLYAFANHIEFTPSYIKIAPTRIADAWRLLVKHKTHIKKNIYDLKPTGAGEAFESGIDARQIQLQIRHHSLEQTQIYLDKYVNKAGLVFRDKMPKFG